jgi:hypothetical protein
MERHTKSPALASPTARTGHAERTPVHRRAGRGRAAAGTRPLRGRTCRGGSSVVFWSIFGCSFRFAFGFGLEFGSGFDLVFFGFVFGLVLGKNGLERFVSGFVAEAMGDLLAEARESLQEELGEIAEGDGVATRNAILGEQGEESAEGAVDVGGGPELARKRSEFTGEIGARPLCSYYH